MSRQLTRDDKTPVLLYKGPATAYNEDVKSVADDKGYRLIDSRGLKKPFISKMRGLESILSDINGKETKLMFVEGEDVKLFTRKPKPTKAISKTIAQQAVESNKSIAKAVDTMAEIASKIGASNIDVEAINKAKDEAEAKAVSLQAELDKLKKASKTENK